MSLQCNLHNTQVTMSTISAAKRWPYGRTFSALVPLYMLHTNSHVLVTLSNTLCSYAGLSRTITRATHPQDGEGWLANDLFRKVTREVFPRRIDIADAVGWIQLRDHSSLL